MNEKNMHGRVFKKLREERGCKSKDITGDIISTRTLTRFEADETSLPIAIFEKLLENCGVLPLDYLAYYNDNIEIEQSKFFKKMQDYLHSGYSVKVINELKKELKKKDIDFGKRVDILFVMTSIGVDENSELFIENKRIIMEKIQKVNRLGWNEVTAFRILINLASREDFTVEYIDRNIEVCLRNISTINYLSKYKSISNCELLSALIVFLSRNGYYSIAEKRCKEVLNHLEKHPLLYSPESYYFGFIGILAKIYLRQNKIEGVELANKLLKYENMLVEITDDPFTKIRANSNYEDLCKANKTGIDFEF